MGMATNHRDIDTEKIKPADLDRVINILDSIKLSEEEATLRIEESEFEEE